MHSFFGGFFFIPYKPLGCLLFPFGILRDLDFGVLKIFFTHFKQ